MNNKYSAPKKGTRILNKQESLELSKKLPTNEQVIQRLKSVQKENNGKNKKIVISIVAKELLACWRKQDMPCRQLQAVTLKLNRIFSKKGSF